MMRRGLKLVPLPVDADREQLLAELEAAAKPVPSGRWTVVRQIFVAGQLVDRPVHGHRWAWVAQLCAHRRERQHAHEAGGHYTVRKAQS